MPDPNVPRNITVDAADAGSKRWLGALYKATRLPSLILLEGQWTKRVSILRRSMTLTVPQRSLARGEIFTISLRVREASMRPLQIHMLFDCSRLCRFGHDSSHFRKI